MYYYCEEYAKSQVRIIRIITSIIVIYHIVLFIRGYQNENYKIKTSFNISLKVIKSQFNKTGINFMIFILIFVENCLLYDAICDLTV